jgi:hypothetical protein
MDIPQPVRRRKDADVSDANIDVPLDVPLDFPAHPCTQTHAYLDP